MILLLSLAIALTTVALCVLVHYEALRITSLQIPRLSIPPRTKVLVVIAAVFLAHVIEVTVFSFAYYIMSHFPILGEIGGNFSANAIDFFYFSITSFTTLGIGDLFPHGGFRLVVGIESLTGFGLIGWSVSFTYLAMQEFWNEHPPRKPPVRKPKHKGADSETNREAEHTLVE